MNANTSIKLLLITALSACTHASSKPSTDADTRTELSPSAEQTVEDDDEPDASVRAEPEMTQVAIDQQLWFAGWRVQLDQVTLLHGSHVTEIKIDATFENLLKGALRSFDDAWIAREIVLASQGKYENVSDIVVPELPFAEPGPGSFSFVAGADFELEDATLLFGPSTYQRAIVPLGPRGQALVSLEPLDLMVNADLTVDQQTFHVDTGRVDASELDWQTERGELAVGFRVDVALSRAAKLGNNVSREHFKVELPDGSIVPANAGPNEILSPGEAQRDLYVEFIIPAPYDGSYALLLEPQGTEETGQIPFTISGADAAFP